MLTRRAYMSRSGFVEKTHEEVGSRQVGHSRVGRLLLRRREAARPEVRDLRRQEAQPPVPTRSPGATP